MSQPNYKLAQFLNSDFLPQHTPHTLKGKRKDRRKGQTIYKSRVLEGFLLLLYPHIIGQNRLAHVVIRNYLKISVV